MKTSIAAFILATACILTGCVSGPEKLTRTELDFVRGTNVIKLRTPKEYKIKKLKLNEKDGLEIEGLVSTVNAGAVEAQTAQAEMMNQLMIQNSAMIQQFGNLAAQYFSGGVVRGNEPFIPTNRLVLPSNFTAPQNGGVNTK